MEAIMRIFTVAALLVVGSSLSLTGCLEKQTLDIRPKSGVLLIDSADVVYVQAMLADVAKEHDLGPQKLVSTDMIASYEGGKNDPFSSGLAFIILWQYANPSYLEIDINGPTPVGATPFSKRIFREVKSKLIEHFGSDRVRDWSKAVIGV
jgi:hypothetical protein